jgi:hypothetical protein
VSYYEKWCALPKDEQSNAWLPLQGGSALPAANAEPALTAIIAAMSAATNSAKIKRLNALPVAHIVSSLSHHHSPLSRWGYMPTIT